MIALLGKLFIKDHTNTADESVRRAWGTLCGVMGVVLNIILCIGKLLARTFSAPSPSPPTPSTTSPTR